MIDRDPPKKDPIPRFSDFTPHLSLIIPAALIFSPALVFFYFYGTTEFFELVSLLLLYLLPPIGKITIITAAMAIGFSWETISFAIIYVDAISCLFVLWNFDNINQIPGIHKWMEYFNQKGGEVAAQYPWIRRFCFIGLLVLTILPIQGSGAIGGPILGRILGLNISCTFLAVMIGSVLQTVIFGVSMNTIQKYLDINLWYLVGLFLIIIMIPSVLSFRYYLKKKQTDPEDK